MPEENAEWDCVVDPTDYVDSVVQQREELAEAASSADWHTVFSILTYQPDWVNVAGIDSDSGRTPLHEAALHGANYSVVERLLEYGAWLTLRTSAGEQAHQIAERQGHVRLLKLLKPVIRHELAEGVCELLELHLHQLMRERTRSLLGAEHSLRLPQLEPITELSEPRFWCPVPGMYGGFSYLLLGEELIVESFSQSVDGSRQQHRVSTNGCELLKEGEL